MRRGRSRRTAQGSRNSRRAAATASGAAELARFTSGSADSTAFTEVNRTGPTQLRLRLADAPASTAYLFLRTGAEAKLTVEWE
ncbi:hypothetical protein ADL27_09300 [Streptomyces sp. NRRL F-6602]|nr:hypothetical protein ADL27_09300 [Streptomyces sp. NRRL F-6602]